MRIRKAKRQEIAAVAEIFERIHSGEEAGETVIGWIRGVYPTERTAQDAYDRGDLFVLETEEGVAGAGIINQLQVDCYREGKWSEDVPEEDVMVLHTLVIDPAQGGRGYGKAFVGFYESYTRQQGCSWLRIDTNERNRTARAMYRKLGYREVGIVPTVFNGIPGVQLVLLEKRVREETQTGREGREDG